jgi:hypothetical protein
MRETADEAEGGSGKAPFVYDGFVLVRPIGRGIVLLDAEGEPYLEDLPDGYYRAHVRFEPRDRPLEG